MITMRNKQMPLWIPLKSQNKHTQISQECGNKKQDDYNENKTNSSLDTIKKGEETHENNKNLKITPVLILRMRTQKHDQNEEDIILSD